jgi:hypothetical protein
MTSCIILLNLDMNNASPSYDICLITTFTPLSGPSPLTHSILVPHLDAVRVIGGRTISRHDLNDDFESHFDEREDIETTGTRNYYSR